MVVKRCLVGVYRWFLDKGLQWFSSLLYYSFLVVVRFLMVVRFGKVSDRRFCHRLLMGFSTVYHRFVLRWSCGLHMPPYSALQNQKG